MLSNIKKYFITYNHNTYIVQHTTSNIYDKEYNSFKIGQNYDNYINISVINQNTADISHIKYEPECGLKTLLTRGADTVEMITLSLQIVKNKVPAVRYYQFDDMSNIECHELLNTKPPRNSVKPIPLNALYIVLHGKTWYEHYFNARMRDANKYKIYRDKISKLYSEFDSKILADIIRDIEIINRLAVYFKTDISWIEFFNLIPHNKRCIVLYGWLNNFIKIFLEDTFFSNNWIIDIDKIKQIPITITQSGGGKIKPHNNKKSRIVFSNEYYHLPYDTYYM